MVNFALTPAIREAWGNRDIPPEQNMIQWAADNLLVQGKTFVDIGAHVGSYALQYAEAGFEVHAFEAQRNTFHYLCANIALNGLSDRVNARHVALGEGEQRLVELRIISADGGGSSAASLSTHQTPMRTESVECRSLDSYRLSNVGLIKIDVEGAERLVIRGARRTLAENGYPKILFETWRPSRMPEAAKLRAELFDELESLGYRVIPTTYDEMFLAER